MQQALFLSEKEQISLQQGAAISYWPDAFSLQASGWMQYLQHAIVWQQNYLRMADKTIAIPRLQAYYGDAAYAYSGLSLLREPWNSELLEIKQAVEQLTECEFNAVLCNYYRNGQDSVAWHSDDEPELGPAPIIASLSLGGVRRFSLRHNASAEITHIDLAAGSLLLMNAKVQQYYQHALLKVDAADARINLTFRQIIL